MKKGVCQNYNNEDCLRECIKSVTSSVLEQPNFVYDNNELQVI